MNNDFFIENIYNRNMYKTAPFKEVRYYKKNKKEYHEGQDFGSKLKTNQKLNTCLTGVIDSIKFNHKYYGNQITIKTKLSYINGPSIFIYSSFCHLNKFSQKVSKIHKNNFIPANTFIGYMGNTGNSKGVHLHFMIYEKYIDKNFETELLKELKKTISIKEDDYLYQWGKLYYNPEKIHEYIKYLIGGNI